MDTAWFAVDSDGHVARFDTGEDGALPLAAAHRGGPDDPNFDVAQLVWVLEALRGEELPEGAYSERLPGLYEFHRDHGDDVGRYFRRAAPDAPLRVDELPEPMRAAMERLRLPVRFADDETVHLADHLSQEDVATWGEMPLRWPEEDVQAPQPAAEPAPSSRWWLWVGLLLGLAALGVWLTGGR
jgi:hypothetical protein